MSFNVYKNELIVKQIYAELCCKYQFKNFVKIHILFQEQGFSLLHSVLTGCGAHQPPVQWVPDDLSLGVKRPGREANHSPTSSTEVKMVELYATPHMFSWHSV
jgi:hypothetical protein